VLPFQQALQATSVQKDARRDKTGQIGFASTNSPIAARLTASLLSALLLNSASTLC
jgi:hypothetical protein